MVGCHLFCDRSAYITGLLNDFSELVAGIGMSNALRVQINATGQAELKLKAPWRDGTTHRVMSPLEFLQRLAALVPGPRLHLIRFLGVLVPNAKLRPLVVTQGPPKDEEVPGVGASGVQCQAETETAQAGPGSISWAWLLKRVLATT